MLLRIIKIGYVIVNILLLFVAGIRMFMPLYLRYGNAIVKNLNYDRFVEITSLWMIILVPWDIILAVSGIRSIVRNDREQVFENAFKLSVYGLVIIWFVDGLGDRFQIGAPLLLKHRIQQYHQDPRAKSIVDLIQTKFKCCGFNNAFVWNPHVPTPDSCCVNNTCSSGNIYAIGCSIPLADYLETLNLWLILVNFPFVELLVSVWNCLLTDYLPPPEIVYQLGSNDEAFERVQMTEIGGEERPLPNPKEAILRTSIGENTLSRENHEQILLVEYNNLLAQMGQQPSSSSFEQENERSPFASPSLALPFNTPSIIS